MGRNIRACIITKLMPVERVFNFKLCPLSYERSQSSCALESSDLRNPQAAKRRFLDVFFCNVSHNSQSWTQHPLGVKFAHHLQTDRAQMAGR